MKVLIRNKILFFILYISISLAVSVVLLTMREYQTAGIIVLLFSAVSGTIFFIAEVKNALKIAIYFLSFLLAMLIGFAFYYLADSIGSIGLHLSLTVAILSTAVLYSVSIICGFQEHMHKSLIGYFDSKAVGEPEKFDYKLYQRYCIREWFHSQSNFISNQELPMKLIRIIGLIVCVSIGILGILGKAVSVFDQDIIFDKLLYGFIILFGLVYFMSGLRFSAIPSFVAWLLIFSSYFIHMFFHGAVDSRLQHDIMAYTVIVLMFSLCILPLYYYLRNELLYSNVQMFERGDHCITVDLFLTEFIPIVDTDRLLTFDIAMKEFPKVPRDFVQLLKYYVNIMRSRHALFAGYVTHSLTGHMTFYVYTNRFTAGLEEEIRNKTHASGFEIENYKCESDSDWTAYKTILNPSNAELCGIISRSYIEQLFMRGISFDREYEINFFVNFKDKNDPVDFEKEIKYFGFSLIYASYDEENDGIDSEYKYYGEYRVSSFISYRRIEYLNKLLLDKTEGFGSLYLGEWQIED